MRSSTNALSVENTCSNISNCNGMITAGLVTGGISPFYYYVNRFGSNIPQGPISIDSTFHFFVLDNTKLDIWMQMHASI